VFKHRFFVSFFITMCFYALLAFALFYTHSLHISTKQKPQEQIITISLDAFEPEFVSPPKEIEVKEPEVEEPKKEEPIPEPIKEVEPEVEEPVAQEQIVKKIIHDPIIKSVIPKPKRVIKKIVKKKVEKKKTTKKKRVKKKVVKKRSVKKKVVKHKVSRKKPSHSKRINPAQKNAYLAHIRSKINKNKTYPRIAQRRGMQGTVKVRFTILKSGNVGNISVSGPKVFHRSVKNAVKKSFPINPKTATISLPITINTNINYRIQ